MGKYLLRLYALFREPKVFLTIMCGFITISLTAHVLRSYDVDLGLTNLILSIEASLYGVVSSIMVKGVSRKQDEMAAMQQKQLEALIAMAELAKERDIEQISLLTSIRERLPQTLTGEKHDVA